PVETGAPRKVARKDLEAVVDVSVEAPRREGKRQQREAEGQPDADTLVEQREDRDDYVAQAEGAGEEEQVPGVDEPEQHHDAARHRELERLEKRHACRLRHRRAGYRAARRRRAADPRRLGLFRPPQLLEPCRPPARELVEVVTERVALVVILMVVLGGVELGRRDDLGDDLAGQHAALLELLLRALRELALMLVVIKDRAAVLVASIAELPAGIERVDVVPEDFEQRVVGDDLAVVLDLHGFGMSGVAPGYLLVLRVRHAPADVA